MSGAIDIGTIIGFPDITEPRYVPPLSVTAGQMKKPPLQLPQRAINVSFQLQSGSFAESENKSNTVTLSGLRVAATISNIGAATDINGHFRIWGMTLPMMNRLSTLGLRVAVRETNWNMIAIDVGKVGEDPLTRIYKGNIYSAWINAEGAPEVVFDVTAQAGYHFSLQPISPTAFPGRVPVATIMRNIITQAGGQLVNWGVDDSHTCNNFYSAGAVKLQAQKCAAEAGIDMLFDESANTLQIWPHNGSRGPGFGSAIPLISPDTGLVGYPTFSENGIRLRTIYDPNLRWGILIQVKDSILGDAVNKEWFVQTLDVNLESETPNGQWFCELECVEPGYGVAGGMLPVASGPYAGRLNIPNG